MVLDEGRNREIRRLLARIGHKVQRLTRIAVGPVRLGDLPSGAVRLLTKQEISALRQAIAAGPRKKTAPKPAPRIRHRPSSPTSHQQRQLDQQSGTETRREGKIDHRRLELGLISL